MIIGIVMLGDLIVSKHSGLLVGKRSAPLVSIVSPCSRLQRFIMKVGKEQKINCPMRLPDNVEMRSV